MPLLLTDGSIMVQDGNNVTYPYPITNHWWKELTPDINGNYVNGTWTRLADAAVDHAPLFYASAVLADGRVFVGGGEYNLGAQVWTNRCEIYDPVANTWANVAPPAGWPNIGDAACVVLPNGKLMLSNIAFQPIGQTPQIAFLDPTTLTWTSGSMSGKEPNLDEENWTLLGDGTVLTVDVVSTPNAEKYIPFDNNWVSAGTTPSAMTNSTSLGYEMGPSVLRFDGTVMAFGANSFTAIYTPPATPTDPGSWAAGPPMTGLGMADAPACLLPNGRILIAASPLPIFNGTPTSFFETDGVTLTPEPGTPRAGVDNCFLVTYLVLPNGQVLESDTSPDMQVYTPTGGPLNAWRPTISTAPATVAPGTDYMISGTQFNGLSQTNAYGDDWSNASNYPLVRITNNSSGHVFYCRTHDHSNMGVATGGLTVSTHFLVPAGIETGASTIAVVANGISSATQAINVSNNTPPVAHAGADQVIEATGPTTGFTLDGTASTDADSDPLSYTWYDSSNAVVGTGSTLNLSQACGVYTYKLTVDDGTDTNSDTVQITIQDTTPPAFGAISNISQTATGAAGNNVTFSSPIANDLVDGAITGTCVPPSGSLFGPGDTTVNVSATDAHLNTGHATFHVFITFSWSGFLSPFPKEPFKMGSTIPIKFKLTGASAGITNLVAHGLWAPVVGNVAGSYTNIGTFTYSTGQYQLNWKTTGRPKGTYRIKADLGDGVLHTVDIILK
jgi:hypothetical protein